MNLAVVVAVAENGVIGRDGVLPWRLRSDLRYFRSVTLGKPVVMGRRTFLSIGRPLPERINIVVSKSPDFAPADVTVVPSLGQALDSAAATEYETGAEEAVVIGGAQLYKEALPVADRLYLTRVHATVNGDVYFPGLVPEHWKEVSQTCQLAGPEDDFDHSYVVLERIGGG